ncbi:MAG: serine/threonine protein kinase [Myxococcaceae bacterium]|nr:serine/threonine protein kinase [Myxococcaceae bacterium]
MAEVWRAKTFGAGGFERIVAVKRILPSIAEDEDFITMFIDEAKITVQLNHANIGQIYELSHVGNSYFISMEYLSGRDLRSVFDRARKRGELPPIPLVCYAIAKCCEGLDYAHRKKDNLGRDLNIVHRDVSPQNLFVSFDGEIKVIDFGIAKAAGKVTKTKAGILKGKFGYMSPEQVSGLSLDRRSDIFGIGICLYELLTGERAFQGENDFSVLERVRNVDVLPPSTFNRKIHETLEHIVMKALSKDPANRFNSAGELADELQRFVVTPENVFGRKDMAQFMRSAFAEDYEKEKQRLRDYAEVTSMPRPSAPPPGGETPGTASDEGTVAMVAPWPSAPSPEISPSAGSSDDNRTHVLEDHDALTRPTAPLPPPPQTLAAAVRSGLNDASFDDEATATQGPLLDERPSISAVLKPAPPVISPLTAGVTGPAPGVLGSRTMSLEGPVVHQTDKFSLPAILKQNPSLWLSAFGGLLSALLLGVWLFSGPPNGLLLIDLPLEAAKNVRININGEELQVAAWPLLRKEPSGKVTVMVVADGYETLLETVEVKPGNEYTQLKSKLVKKP